MRISSFSIIFFLIIFHNIYAENFSCGTITETTTDFYPPAHPEVPDEIITIPVAFHIIRYDNGSADVTNQQIYDQMYILNDRFRGTTFRFSFLSIDRTNNSEWTEHNNPSEEEKEMKDQLKIDVDNVLNVYICANFTSEGDGVDGYAYQPFIYYQETNKYLNGAVIKTHRLPGGSDPEPNVLVHEIGHYLGLYHTFLGNTCTGMGDWIDDTPMQSTSSLSCSYKNSCYEGSGDLPDDVSNYMDYALSCANHFTEGQAIRMYEVMEYYHPSMFGTAFVTFDQKKKSGSQAYPEIFRWQNLPDFVSYFLFENDRFRLHTGTSNEVFLSHQGVLNSTPPEKYNNWVVNQTSQQDVTNHHVFSIEQNTSTIDAQFDQIFYNISIQNNFYDVPSLQGTIEFKDPWLIDYADPLYAGNMRNRGISNAPFIEINGELDFSQPVYSSYKGVFLDQGWPGWVPPYYSVRTPETVDFGASIGERNVYLENWSASPAGGASFEHPDTFETAVVFHNDGVVVSAKLKASLISTKSTAFSKNNQRKTVCTVDGWQHIVYESADHIWYENKSPGGDWQIVGKVNGELFLDDAVGKNPSIDYCEIEKTGDNENVVVISFQEGNTLQLRAYTRAGSMPQFEYQSSRSFTTNESSGSNLYSNVAMANNGIIMLLWEKNASEAGLFYRVMQYELGNGITDKYVDSGYNYIGQITGTNYSSGSATLSCDKNSSPQFFDVAWVQSIGFQNAPLKYCYLSYNGSIVTEPMNKTISSSSFKYNSNPSIITVDGNPRVVWVADLSGTWNPSLVKTIVRNAYTSGSFSYYDYASQSTTVNKLNDDAGYYFAWSKYYNNTWYNRYVSSDNLSQIKTNLGTSGKELQFPNSDDPSDIKAIAYYHSSLPYYFTESNAISNNFSKSSGIEGTLSGRGFIIADKDYSFHYLLSDMKVGQQAINFVNMIDTLNYSKLDTMNSALITQPFIIDNKLPITFNESIGSYDPASVSKNMKADKYVNVNIELIDAISNQSIGMIKQSKLKSKDDNTYGTKQFTIDLSKTSYTNVYMKITMDHNLSDPELAVINEFMTDEDAFGRVTTENLVFEEDLSLNEFALYQNYPNPFNPTTEIVYHLPEKSSVKLAVYDLLGREVKVLVNKIQEKGRYQVTLIALNLATGIYIYKLQAGKYNASRKMILIK